MIAHVKTTVTLLVLAAVLVVGAVVGTKLLLAKADVAAADTPTCTDRTLKAGEKLTPNFVTVHVFNSGTTTGLANRVRINLQRDGFLGGDVGNSPGGIVARSVTILTEDPQQPAVALVAKQFAGTVEFAEPPAGVPADGVTLVVGDSYAGLKKGAAREVTLADPITVCELVDPDAEVAS